MYVCIRVYMYVYYIGLYRYLGRPIHVHVCLYACMYVYVCTERGGGL